MFLGSSSCHYPPFLSVLFVLVLRRGQSCLIYLWYGQLQLPNSDGVIPVRLTAAPWGASCQTLVAAKIFIVAVLDQIINLNLICGGVPNTLCSVQEDA